MLDPPEEIGPFKTPAAELTTERKDMDQNDQKNGNASGAVQLDYSLVSGLCFHNVLYWVKNGEILARILVTVLFTDFRLLPVFSAISSLLQSAIRRRSTLRSI